MTALLVALRLVQVALRQPELAQPSTVGVTVVARLPRAMEVAAVEALRDRTGPEITAILPIQRLAALVAVET